MRERISNIGERIKLRRAEMNITLVQLARRAGLSKSYLHAIETGVTQSPSVYVLYRIANGLGTTIADLLLGEEQFEPDAVDISESLGEFADAENLTEADVVMLNCIQYRGKRPENVEDWRYIFESIKRTLR